MKAYIELSRPDDLSEAERIAAEGAFGESKGLGCRDVLSLFSGLVQGSYILRVPLSAKRLKP